MGLIMKNGISYGGGSGTAADTKHIDITQAEYDELQSKGLVDSTATYFVIDGEYSEGGGNANIVKLTQAEYNALPESKNSDGILYAITDGESSSGSTSKPVELTKAQYEALGDSVLNDNILYAITDGDELSAKNLAFDDTETQLGANNVQDAIVEQNKNLKFKLVGTATSASVLTLPDNFDELYIVSSIIGGWNIANTIHKEAITDNACIPVNTAHSHDTTFAFVGVIFPTKKQIKVHFASENDFIKTDDVSISVYYR